MAQNRAVTLDRVEKQNNAAGWSFSFVQVGFWMSFCVSVSFAAVYLQAIGYSNGELGLILALGSVLGIAAAIFLAGWIDKDRHSDMGFITAFKGLVEIPVMFLYVRFFKDGMHSLALRITAVSFVLKTLAFIMAGTVWQLTAAFILQAPSYALYMTAVVAYVRESIGFEDSAKAQTLAFTTTSFGGMLASLIGGQLYDNLSVTMTLWVAFACGAAGAVIMFLGTRKKEV